MLSIMFGTAYEVSPNDETLGSPNVRTYRTEFGIYIGYDTAEIVHVCDEDCAMAVLPDEYFRGLFNNLDGCANYASCHPWQGEHGTMVRTADVLEFDPGDDPYIRCGACGTELVRDDEAYEAMYGDKIKGPTPEDIERKGAWETGTPDP